MDVQKMKEILDKEKKDGKIIILCCGCFEIFHVGHLEYLNEAKKYGDILAVGLNSDSYIQKHKHRKPIFKLEQRMQIVFNIKAVDYVFYFEEDTFDRSIEFLQPDYFIKGIDRSDILEKETCNKYSVKILRVGTKKIYSSTKLINYFR